jgi:hypothetical protein
MQSGHKGVSPFPDEEASPPFADEPPVGVTEDRYWGDTLAGGLRSLGI